MSADAPPLQQALHRLYRDHHGWLFIWLRRKLGCAHNAADLAQDTFVRIIASRDALAAMREPRAYLATTAKRLIIDRSRRRQLEEAYLHELTLTAAVLAEAGFRSPAQIHETLEALEQIAFVLEGLSEKAHQIFLMYFLEDCNQAEIARRQGISERMVRKYLTQALAHCSQALDV